MCARRLADDELKPKVAQIFADNYEVYGARKIKASLKREHDAIVDRARVTCLSWRFEAQPGHDPFAPPSPTSRHREHPIS